MKKFHNIKTSMMLINFMNQKNKKLFLNMKGTQNAYGINHYCILIS